MVEELQGIVEEVRRFVPTLLGVVVISEDGLPLSYHFSRAWNVEDPIVISGLLSSATSMIENVLREFGDSEAQLLYSQGKEYSIMVGRAGNVFVAFLATADTKLGPLFMEMRRQSDRIKKLFQE
ncbi:MAG: hypothetical protein GXO39_04035 [Thermotogae bacterium]|nr:hypothetical protein [Thermotogota bacterium]